ncbi:MAG: magnesium transporter [Candidatus Aenigmarchaeota archaeon]|nr:magnesium transporter [Candidatus Aenigmarchaeota archaeon]
MSHKKRMLQKVTKVRRHEHHPVLHHVHRKYGISRRTLFYMKEYGPRSHVAHVIIRESLKILIIASIISSIGGISMESISAQLLVITPLLILMPAMNDMVGDFGCIVSSKFTTMLYLGKVHRKWWRSRHLHTLFLVILFTSFLTSVFIGVAASVIAYWQGFSLTFDVFLKILSIAVMSNLIIVAIIFCIAIIGGLGIYGKNEDPNNFLIPITTSVADLLNLVIFAVLVGMFF